MGKRKTSSPSNGNGHTKHARDLLREAFAKLGWNQNRAARELEVSPTTLSRWLSGKRAPDRQHMAMLRDRFGISPEIWV